MRIGNDTLIDAAVDLSSAWSSDAIWCGHVGMYSIRLEFTGGPSGVWSLQCSNDKGQELQSGAQMASGVTGWSTINGSSQTITASGDHAWSVTDVSYRWVRAHWEPSVAAGSLTSARFNTKGF